MSANYVFITALVCLSVLGSFLKTLIGIIGLPNLIPIVRDSLILIVFFKGLGQLNIFRENIWGYILILLGIFSCLYISASVVDGRFFVGLYYLRLYLLPILFFIGLYGLFKNINIISTKKYIKFILIFNIFVFIIALSLYIMMFVYPNLKTSLFSEKLIPTAWYISGGTWMRMGLPASGPNSLGLIFSINATLFVALILNFSRFNVHQNFNLTKSILVLSTSLAIIGLVLSFSRSSMLLLFFCIPMLFIYSGFSFSKIFKLLFTSSIGLILIIVTSLIIDEYSGGFITRWFILNTNLSDPSMIGHFDSIANAFEKVNEYYLYGYPRGTVGPKALMFTGTVNNVENTLLTIIFDMGIFIGLFFLILIFLLHLASLSNKNQVIFFFGFLLPCMLLPYVFELDMLTYYVFAYQLLGQFDNNKKN